MSTNDDELGQLGEVGLGLKADALDFTSCGVTLADARHPELPLIYVNDAFERMSGYSGADLLGKNCRVLQRHDREQTALDDLRTALKLGKECKVTLRNYMKDGTLFWNELNLSPILDQDQNIAYFIGVQTDVSELQHHRRMQERMIAELQVINEDLDSFAHIVSHDLRAPLRGVQKLCQMLADNHQDGLDDKGRHLVDLMGSRVSRMTGLLEGVLRYSRSRGEQPSWQEVDTGRLVRNVGSLLDLPSGIDLRIAADMPTLYCDATRLNQIFQNLIDNAAKFQEGTGWIAVRGQATAEGWHFSVADNGPGIEPEHRERIFGIFQTTQSRDQLETSGVGLAVARKAVERLGGRIWVESEPDSGATFHFTLPSKPQSTESETAEP